MEREYQTEFVVCGRFVSYRQQPVGRNNTLKGELVLSVERHTKQDVRVEQPVFTLWGKAAEALSDSQPQHGDWVRVEGYLGGHEYNGRHYADVTATRCAVDKQPQTAGSHKDGHADASIDEGEVPF